MRTASLSKDDALLARLQAPPDLGDGVQSLAYWRERSRRLPWYRMRARREAAEMTLRWERRVRGALVSQRGVAVDIRLAAGLLVARTRLRRWSRRASVVVVMTIGVALIAAPIVAAAVLMIRVF
jgi:hypothetical protein